MIEIPLSRGLVALIDDEDLPLVEGVKWCAVPVRNTFYAQRRTRNGERAWQQMHRVILCANPGQIVDHRDRNGLNNTRANLRLCTVAQNAFNRFQQASNKTGYKGVSFDKLAGGYRAQIRTRSKSFNLGNYADLAEAARAYDAAARKYFGEFAYLNFPA